MSFSSTDKLPSVDTVHALNVSNFQKRPFHTEDSQPPLQYHDLLRCDQAIYSCWGLRPVAIFSDQPPKPAPHRWETIRRIHHHAAATP